MSRRVNRFKVFHRSQLLPRAAALRWVGLALLSALLLLFAANLGVFFD
jgi:hypothetical protein